MKLGDSLGRNRKRRKGGPKATPDSSTVDQGETASGTVEASSDVEADTPAPAAPTRPRGSGWLNGRTLFVGLALVVIGGWFGGYALATQVFFPAPPPPGDLYEVPDVRGLGLASAEERLRACAAASAGLPVGGPEAGDGGDEEQAAGWAGVQSSIQL
ncbi:MAG: hypothetical protein ACPHQP_05340, partial [Longimicrobiales bacterium]